tara:strand:- start:167 stop:406 length:240 start_codon:yes stop_codon:yes gene_type:complete
VRPRAHPKKVDRMLSTIVRVVIAFHALSGVRVAQEAYHSTWFAVAIGYEETHDGDGLLQYLEDLQQGQRPPRQAKGRGV